MRRAQLFGLAAAAGTILLLSIIAFRSYWPYAQGGIAPNEPPKVALAMRDAYFVGLGRRGKLWSLKARSVEIGQDRSVTTLRGVTDGRIFGSGRVLFKVRAGKAVYDAGNQTMRLCLGILIKGNKGQSVAATNARWSASNSTLESGGAVRFRTPSGETRANHLTVDLKKKELLMNNVCGKIDVGNAGNGN